MKSANLLLWLRWINVVVILLTLIAYASPLVSPARGWLPALFAVFFPWLLLANGLFIGLWAVLLSRYAFLSLACLLLGWGHVSSFIGLNPGAAKPSGNQVLRVATFNIHNLVDRSDREHWISTDMIQDLVRQSSADVFCFQEFSDRKVEDYVETLRNEGPLRYEYYEHGSMLVLSRYPIEQGREVLFSNHSNGFQEVDIRVGQQRVRIMNLHLQSNGISSNLREWAYQREDLSELSTLGRLSHLFRQYFRNAKVRAEQAERVAAAVKNSRHPVIVSGDFNDVPLSWTYRRLTADLEDPFRRRGFGLGTTYSGFLPALRIDYILMDPRMRALSYRIGEADFSDHRPVWCTLELPAP